HVGAHLEAGARVPGLHHRVLRQVVGLGRVTAQRARKGAQVRDEEHKLTLEFLVVGAGARGSIRGFRAHPPFSEVLASCWRRISRNSSGTSSLTTSSNIWRRRTPIACWRRRASSSAADGFRGS